MAFETFTLIKETYLSPHFDIQQVRESVHIVETVWVDLLQLIESGNGTVNIWSISKHFLSDQNHRQQIDRHHSKIKISS